MWSRGGLEVVSRLSRSGVEAVYGWNIVVFKSRESKHTGVLNSGELTPLRLIRSCSSSICTRGSRVCRMSFMSPMRPMNIMSLIEPDWPYEPHDSYEPYAPYEPYEPYKPDEPYELYEP